MRRCCTGYSLSRLFEVLTKKRFEISTQKEGLFCVEANVEVSRLSLGGSGTQEDKVWYLKTSEGRRTRGEAWGTRADAHAAMEALIFK